MDEHEPAKLATANSSRPAEGGPDRSLPVWPGEPERSDVAELAIIQGVPALAAVESGRRASVFHLR